MNSLTYGLSASTFLNVSGKARKKRPVYHYASLLRHHVICYNCKGLLSWLAPESKVPAYLLNLLCSSVLPQHFFLSSSLPHKRSRSPPDCLHLSRSLLVLTLEVLIYFLGTLLIPILALPVQQLSRCRLSSFLPSFLHSPIVCLQGPGVAEALQQGTKGKRAAHEAFGFELGGGRHKQAGSPEAANHTILHSAAQPGGASFDVHQPLGQAGRGSPAAQKCHHQGQHHANTTTPAAELMSSDDEVIMHPAQGGGPAAARMHIQGASQRRQRHHQHLPHSRLHQCSDAAACGMEAEGGTAEGSGSGSGGGSFMEHTPSAHLAASVNGTLPRHSQQKQQQQQQQQQQQAPQPSLSQTCSVQCRGTPGSEPHPHHHQQFTFDSLPGLQGNRALPRSSPSPSHLQQADAAEGQGGRGAWGEMGHVQDGVTEGVDGAWGEGKRSAGLKNASGGGRGGSGGPPKGKGCAGGGAAGKGASAVAAPRGAVSRTTSRCGECHTCLNRYMKKACLRNKALKDGVAAPDNASAVSLGSSKPQAHAGSPSLEAQGASDPAMISPTPHPIPPNNSPSAHFPYNHSPHRRPTVPAPKADAGTPTPSPPEATSAAAAAAAATAATAAAEAAAAAARQPNGIPHVYVQNRQPAIARGAVHTQLHSLAPPISQQQQEQQHGARTVHGPPLAHQHPPLGLPPISSYPAASQYQPNSSAGLPPLPPGAQLHAQSGLAGSTRKRAPPTTKEEPFGQAGASCLAYANGKSYGDGINGSRQQQPKNSTTRTGGHAPQVCVCVYVCMCMRVYFADVHLLLG